jgi:hypothetical protein
MGIFDQMLESDISARLKNSPTKKTADEKNATAQNQPNVRCEKCGSVQFWLDAYGNWNCGGCNPPRVPALIREIHTINPTAERADIDGQEWIRRQDCRGRDGYELASLPEKSRWWARWDFEDLPTGENLPIRKSQPKGGLPISNAARS